MEIVVLIVGIGAGILIGWLFGKNKASQMVSREEYETRANEVSRLEAEKYALNEKAQSLQTTVNETKTQVDEAQKQSLELTAENSKLANQLQNLEEKLATQKEEIEVLQQRLAKEFENLANKIFEEKSEKFVRQNRDSLDIVLNPLKEKMEEFKQKVETTHLESTKEQSRLQEQIRNLTELNQGMREDANRLTQALKGESKTQGNWGEMILERVLEKSGLTKGQEYTVQESFTNEEGRRQQPDVIIKLPDNKNIIVDSKVSLTAYERITSTSDVGEQEAWLKAHIKSIREHIKQLSDKKYHQLYEVDSPDFVLLFIPIESAFSLAMQNDNEIFNDAFDRNIVIVTTSTLLATLRTIANIWKQEYQNRNVLEIARQGGDLYDKFVGFTENLIDLGKKMKAAQVTYEDSMKKLVDGRGNLIKRAENLRELGAKVSKQLDTKLVDRAQD